MKLVSTLALLLFALAFAPSLSATPAPAPPAPACSAAPAAAMPLQLAAVMIGDAKCASCNDQFRACKEYCGTNNPIFSCQGSNPCAATCVCP